MKFGQFFTEVCAFLRDTHGWVAPETLATQRTEILDIMHQQYQLAEDDVVNAPDIGSDQMSFYM